MVQVQIKLLANMGKEELIVREIIFDYPVKEFTYKVIGERKLKFYIFESEIPQKNRPVILFFIGGSFSKDPVSPARFQEQAKYFTSKGLVAVCVEYRNGADEGFTPIQAIQDVKSAVRSVRENYAFLGVDPNKIVVCGSSAGAYISVSSIMFEEINNETDNLSTDHLPNALVVFAGGMDGVDIMKRRYPELLEKSTELSPIHHIKNCLPKTIWFCGTAERDYDQNKEFTQRMVEKGNEITFIEYENMVHGFFHFGRNNNKYYQDTIQKVEGFLKDTKFI